MGACHNINKCSRPHAHRKYRATDRQTERESERQRERGEVGRRTKDVQTEASFCHSSHRKSATLKQNMSSRKKAKIKVTTLAKSDYSDAVIARRFMRQSEPETCWTLGQRIDSKHNERQIGFEG